jgi:hypothetical protein
MKKSILTILGVLVLGALFAQAPQSFSYQGVARGSTGLPLNNQTIGLQITILSGGVTGTIEYTETHTVITNQFGLFTAQIGNGTLVTGSFTGIGWGSNTHFVQVEMDETGGSNYQMMGTSQLLSVPYALYAEGVANADDADANPSNEFNTALALNGTNLEVTDLGGTLSLDLATFNDNTDNQTLSLNGMDLTISGGNTITLPSGGGANTLDMAYDQGGAGAGRMITADAGAVDITTSTASATALDVNNTATGVSVSADNSDVSNTFSTIQAVTNSNSNAASAVVGNSDGLAWGVSGQASSTSTAAAAVYGSNLRTAGGHGVLGIGVNGVVGQTDYQTGFGVYGINNDLVAPLGNAVGTYGRGWIGVYGEPNPLTGAFGVYSNGDFTATGTKAFTIDHPQDPENKYLKHFSIESDEVLNMYRGVVTVGSNGEATIELPDYFESINTNFSYHLTPIGAYAQLFVKEKITGNQFVIAGGQSGMEVSWTVYAERNDAYLQQHPEKRDNVVEKRPHEKGKYLMPDLYNASKEQAVFYVKPEGFKVKQEPLNLKKE